MDEKDACRALFERVYLPILALDAEGYVETCNAAAERFFGYSKKKLLGRDGTRLFAADEERTKARRWTRYGAAGRELRRTSRCRSRDGGMHDVEVHFVPRRLNGDEASGVYAVFHDLDDKRRLEEELRQARKMEAIGHLTGGVAHDFNNLLTAILGYSELLELELGEVRARDLAREIKKATERATQLTSKLLAFARKQDPKPVDLHLNTVVLELESLLKRLLGGRIRITTDLDVDLGLTRVDRTQLEQAILNLAINARDAMPGGGMLTISTLMQRFDSAEMGELPASRPGSYVCLRVRDDGCGMDEATQARVFDPFFTTKEAGKGTGLGLANVYGIVSQAGGWVRVESAPGQGTTFEVGLPEVRPSVPGRATVEASGSVARGRETILVVDDDSQVRRVTRDYLRRSGYKVLEARDEATALDHLRHHEAIDLLLTDVVMPDTSGPELARKLTALRPGMKVLLQSVYRERDVFETGELDGSWAYVQKPVRQKVVSRKVRQLLDS